MFNPKRTPPKQALQRGKSSSDSEITANPQADKSNITTRKRQKISDSPTNNETNNFFESFRVFRNEIKEMLDCWRDDYDRKLSAWKDEQDTILSMLVKDVTDLKQQCSKLQKANKDMEHSVDFMSKCFEDMKSKISELEKEKKELAENLNRANKQVQVLESQSRSACVEIRNVPSKEKEVVQDLLSIMSEVGKAVNMSLESSNLRNIYRLPDKSGAAKPIVTEFVQVSKRNEFLA